jgi:Helicase associated domain
MCGLLTQDDVDFEISLSHYFVWRVAKLTKQNDDRPEDDIECYYANNDPTGRDEQSNESSHMTRSSLLCKYNKIIDVLKTELDYKGLLQSVVDEYDSKGIDPEIYSRWQRCSSEMMNQGVQGNDNILAKGAECIIIAANTKYDDDNKPPGRKNQRPDDKSIDDDSTNMPKRKSRRLAGNRRNDSLTTGKVKKETVEDLLASDYDSESIAAMRKFSTRGTKASPSSVDLEKRDPQILIDVTRKYRRMQLKLSRLEEKAYQQEEDLLIKQLKFDEEMKLKQEKLKQKEFLQKSQNEKIRKLAERRKSQLERQKKRNHIWNTEFDKLAEFVKENGHCKPSYQSQLGKWVSYQRGQYKGKTGTLTLERIQRLDSIGFDWQQRELTTLEARLQKQIEESSFHTQDDHIFQWMKNTVEHYEKRLEQEDKSKQRPGFDNKRFAERVAELAWVVEKGGSINDKQSILSVFPNNTSLLEWNKTMRKQCKLWKDGKRSQLTEERIAVLNDIGFDFNPRKHYAPPGSRNSRKKPIQNFPEAEELVIQSDSNEAGNSQGPPTEKPEHASFEDFETVFM